MRLSERDDFLYTGCLCHNDRDSYWMCDHPISLTTNPVARSEIEVFLFQKVPCESRYLFKKCSAPGKIWN